MQKIAVTGATGYLGEFLVQKLITDGHIVHAIARNEGKLTSLKEKFPSVNIFPCPVEDEFLMRKALIGCSGVFHLASFKNVGLAEEHPLKTVQTNILGTLNLLKISLLDPGIRFVVGAGTDKSGKISGVYGASRLIMESLFDEYAKTNTSGCKYRVVRYGNIVNSTSSVVEKWREALLNGREITITDPEATRFFMTRDEALQALFTCLEAESTATYIPEMKAMSVQDLFDVVLSKYGNNRNATVRNIGLQQGENKHEVGLKGVTSDKAERWKKEEMFQHI
jgi:UDP-N-acetylglucosamine 4,6-dehydratase